MKMTGAQAIIKCLLEENVKYIYGYPGGAVLPLYDALFETKEIKHILVRGEQAAAHAASGVSRTSDTVGVCVATSGPGATNLVTGIATAYMDSIPMVAITGQVPTGLIGTDAFQEVDITGITLPITKHSYLVKDVKEIPQVIKDAFHIANTGRKGPVLIDIPKNIQMTEFDYKPAHETNLRSYKPNYSPNKKQVMRVAEEIKKAKRPLILSGGGMVMAKADQKLKELLEIAKIPTIQTLMSLGTLPYDHPLYYGMIGLHGSPVANYAVTNADLLISFGARFDDRSTIVTKTFAPKATIVHVDIDPAEIDKNVRTQIPVVSDLSLFLDALLERIEPAEFTEWKAELDSWNTSYPLTYKDEGVLKPQIVLEKLAERTRGNAIISTEVGQHQMWTAQFYSFSNPASFLTSGGLGTMGYGFPAAVGAQMMNPDRLVVNVAGDGSFQMNMAEIGTAIEQNLPIKLLLFNNTSLSLVRQLQYFGTNKRYSGIDFTSNPDFCKLVEAYPNTEAYRIESPDQIDEVFDKSLNNGKFTLIECIVSNEERVYPVACPVNGLNKMNYLDDVEIVCE